MGTAHPYFPPDLSLQGYVEPVLPFQLLLAIFFGGAAAVSIAVWLTTRSFKRVAAAERALTAWLIATGIIHFVIEGAVVLNADFYKDSSGNVLSEIWKEYSKADSRYATRDSFVISMEAVTAFVEGPGCFLAAYGLLTVKPWRYAAVIMVSVGQIYGDILYYVTTLLEGSPHTRPEWLYYWFYFIFVNGIWLIIPGACVLYSVKQLNKAVAAADRTSTKPKRG